MKEKRSGMSQKLVIPFLFCCILHTGWSQKTDSSTVRLDIPTLFDLVVANNPSLKVAQSGITVANQAVEVSKNNRLPNANVGLSAFYLGNVDLFSTNFQNHFVQEMPHFGNALNVEVNQLIWKGGTVNESIRLSKMQAEIASLQYTSAEQQAKLTALGYYLDLYKMHNQSRVYQQNIDLAEQRLKNITNMHSQGMVNKNDLIRGELQISNLKLAKLTIDNGILVLNQQLNVAVGLPEGTKVIPDESILTQAIMLDSYDSYKNAALESNPNVLLTKKSVSIYQSSLKLARKNWYPSLLFFAGNTMQRPVTSSSPAKDMYFNTWNAGLALSYDIGSLWKNTRLVNQRKFEVEKAIQQQQEVEAYISVGINAAYIKHNEALTQRDVLSTNKNLATENYRMMENKYNGQLALIIDLIDASNSKLDSELQYTNAEINIIFAYYRILKETGKL